MSLAVFLSYTRNGRIAGIARFARKTATRFRNCIRNCIRNCNKRRSIWRSVWHSVRPQKTSSPAAVQSQRCKRLGTTEATSRGGVGRLRYISGRQSTYIFIDLYREPIEGDPMSQMISVSIPGTPAEPSSMQRLAEPSQTRSVRSASPPGGFTTRTVRRVSTARLRTLSHCRIRIHAYERQFRYFQLVVRHRLLAH